jgi:rod shape-determining protein MreC
VHLKAINTDLLNRIAKLEMERYAYQNALDYSNDTLQTGKIQIDSLNTLIYQFIPARVVYNSVSKSENYIILNKGSLDGIEVDMGVMSATGIVGVVMETSPNSSLVIPVLNPKFRLSCMVKRNHYFGPLVWDGKDSRYAYLTELPRHIDFEIGDTIVTSFYSGIFPAELPIGEVVDFRKQSDDNYTSLKVRLFANFNTLNEVMIIANNRQKEQKNLLNTVSQ